ncbi:hypothetical protein NODU109028_08950 [Nocardioides dubius]|uniref:Integral membrane protein n=1 Tax=Nocardioides dubius TaxID=317019 RepID=A0ABP4EG45_9ACTN
MGVVKLSSIPTAPLTVVGLVGGFLLANRTGNRPLGGVVMAAANAAALPAWTSRGPATATGLSALYWGAMGASHPLAKKIGVWPSVATVAAVSAGAAWAASDRRS